MMCRCESNDKALKSARHHGFHAGGLGTSVGDGEGEEAVVAGHATGTCALFVLCANPHRRYLPPMLVIAAGH